VTGSILGERVIRKEDPKFLTTGGVYVDDMDEPLLEGALYVTYARSVMAHARITRIDTTAAAGSPGVVAVYTAADLDLEPVPAAFNPTAARTLLASDVTR
jgi:carbon-monoxide dehydrogenase large subunit